MSLDQISNKSEPEVKNKYEIEVEPPSGGEGSANEKSDAHSQSMSASNEMSILSSDRSIHEFQATELQMLETSNVKVCKLIIKKCNRNSKMAFQPP